MKKPVPIQECLLAVYELMGQRKQVVEELTLPDYMACEDDEKDVTLVTLSNLEGLLSHAETTCIKRCALPGL
eukprot:12421038-Karenia_brevis.AAC.1